MRVFRRGHVTLLIRTGVTRAGGGCWDGRERAGGDVRGCGVVRGRRVGVVVRDVRRGW